MFSSLTSMKPSVAQAEDCTKQDFINLFYEDYKPGASWVEEGGSKTIRWTTSGSGITAEAVSRAMTPDEIIWLREAIQSWDEASTSISFEESTDGSGELWFGWLPAQKISGGNTATWSAWNALTGDVGIRNRAMIRFGDGKSFLNEKNGFIHAARHEIGNVLGLGDIRPSTAFFSVMEDPWQPPYGNLHLDDFDYRLIRQLYGESTCPSTWKSQTSVPVTTSVPPIKKDSSKMTCVKGKKIKQVTANRPKCPTGYKKRQ